MTWTIYVCTGKTCPGWFDHSLEANTCGVCGDNQLRAVEVAGVAEARTEYRVARADGLPAATGFRTLADAEQKRQSKEAQGYPHGPYRVEKRVLMVSDWEPAAA